MNLEHELKLTVTHNRLIILILLLLSNQNPKIYDKNKQRNSPMQNQTNEKILIINT